MVDVKVISGNFFIGDKGGNLGKVISLTDDEFKRVKAQGHIGQVLEVLVEVKEDNTLDNVETVEEVDEKRLEELLAKDNLTKKETKELEALKTKLGLDASEDETSEDPDLKLE